MDIKSTFQQAFINLSSAKLRSFLAVLGILVGTAAVVALLSCGRLATEKALEQFKALGTDLLTVTLYQKSKENILSHDSFSLNDWRELPVLIPQIKRIASYATAFQPLSYYGHNLNGSIIGADESLVKIINIHMAQGNFISSLHTFDQFCVVGQTLLEQMRTVNYEDPIGKQIRVGDNLYTIIGVAQPWNSNGFFNEDINTSIIIPIGGIGRISNDTSINNAIMLLDKNTNIDALTQSLTQIFAKKSPKLTSFIRSAKQIIAGLETQGKIFTLLLAIIGGISLLVGGIGVMNIMLVSVSERKKEIGIRKAVGAKNKEIQQLFLTEALLLSLFGGVVGVLVGILFTAIVASVNQWHFTITLAAPLAGFAVSTITGIFFGYYPAKRASLLNPIVTLRDSI
jgi:putative ABC transport system permease protein